MGLKCYKKGEDITERLGNLKIVAQKYDFYYFSVGRRYMDMRSIFFSRICLIVEGSRCRWTTGASLSHVQ